MAQRKRDLRVAFEHVDARLLAVLPVRAELARFGQQIMRCIDEVEVYVREAGLPRAHRDEAVVVYHGPLLAGSRVDIGVEVRERFDSTGPVVCSATPEGTAVTAIHHGAYDGLPSTKALLRQWCADYELEPTGKAWEVYRALDADPATRTTEVFYQLE